MKDIITINDNFTTGMTTNEIAELTGKKHKHVMRDTRVMLLELYGKIDESIFGRIYFDSYNREKPCFALSKNDVLTLVSGYSISLRSAIIKRLEELESMNQPKKLTWLELLEKSLAAEKERIKLVGELDHAIKTKAWISDKKTATAMATASVKSRENEKLKEQIGDSKKFKQVKAIGWIKDYFNLSNNAVYGQIGRQLTKTSKSMNYAWRDVPDTTWGTVKAYHVDVIHTFKMKLNNDLNMMRKYRK